MRLGLGFAFVALLTEAAAIWPLPSSYTTGTSVLFIEPGVQVSYSVAGQEQYDGRYGSRSTPSSVVSTALYETLNTIFYKSFYPWKFHPRNTDFDPSSGGSATVTAINLVQHVADIPTTASSWLDLDESYSLQVDTSGTVTISANSSVGLSYGLTTFSQLFYKTKTGQVYTALAPVYVEDAPLFKHRGLNLDVARCWYPASDIVKQIDALAYNKMNRLHLHITDSQSWPLEVPSLPLLSQKGQYGEGMSYSPETLAYIQQYGQDRGVEVFIEIDMPGHAGIIELAYPGNVLAWNVQPDWDAWAAEPPSGSLRLNSSTTDALLETLFADVVPRTKAYTGLWHAGGDEIEGLPYTLEPGIDSSDSSVIKPFLQRFVDRNLEQIMSYNVTPIVWQELLLTWNLTLPSDAIVQIWLSNADALTAVQAGYRTIVGDYEEWYLDCGYGQWIDFYPADAASYYPFDDYCSPRKNWRQIYTFDPLGSIPANLSHLVLGAEIHSWSEQTDPANVDGKLWPRTAAAAEVLWAGAKDASGQNRSQVLASPRLADMRERLLARGVAAEPVHMPFCTQNGTQCAL